MSQRPLPGVPEGSAGRGRKSRRRGRLQVHDPFELIRWLALSQPDPRKALAELVQNSLDARARHVEIERFRRRGEVCLSIRDDGDGVVPELGREEALRYLATHIGHSRKRSLTPKQRLELMTQGQYGIGLLGFWSLGQLLEIRTFSPDEKPMRLVLERNRPEYRIEALRGRRPKNRTAVVTEVLVVGVHREAMPLLGARRVADYLASELRGQLQQRDIQLTVYDRLARGRAPKRLAIEPKRFAGAPIVDLRTLAVPGYPEIRLDLYLDPGGDGDSAQLALYSAGTVVAESFAELGVLELDRPPFTDPRLAGVIDFPVLTVAPGSRRGVVVDDAARALARALRRIEPRLLHLLEAEDERRRQEIDRGTVRNLQQAYRDLFRQRPRYELLPVADSAGRASHTADELVRAGPGEAATSLEADASEALGDEETPTPALEVSTASVPSFSDLPSGPLTEIRLRPKRLRLPCGGSRIVRAEPLDDAGRLVDGLCEYLWRLHGVEGTLEDQVGTEPRVRLVAGSRPGSGTLRVTVRHGEERAGAEIAVELYAESSSGAGGVEGVPEPELVHDVGAAWRSRFEDGRWRVNSAHPDFEAVAARPALRLRYLALLFAKEVVLHTSKDPRLERPLEEMVEVFGFADQRLTTRGRARWQKRPRKGS